MILGIGTDIVKIERIVRAGQKAHFLERCFTERERQYAKNRMESLAGDFAVKEAVAKALGCGFSGFGPEAIEVLRDDVGKPYVNLKENAKKRAKEQGITQIHVSLSHEEEYAIGYAIAE